jgi:anti-sigma factor RsiW
MHPKNDLLRAYYDHELSPRLGDQIREHLARCAACQKRMVELERREQRVRAQMESLRPTHHEQPAPARAALQRLARPTYSSYPRKDWNSTMKTRKSLWSALAVLAVLVLVFTVTPARAWASSFLSLFRVQQVQVVTFDPAAMREARGQMQENRGAMEAIFNDDLEITEQGSLSEVATVEEAAAAAGFSPRIPAAFDNPKLAVQPGMNALFTIDQPKLQALFDTAGIDVALPESVHGKVVTIDVPDAVLASSGCEGVDPDDPRSARDCDTLVQVPSPVINAPEGLDPAAMGTAMFQFLGLPADEAAALSQRIDWATTLVLPIPNDPSIQYREVQVDGVTGTLLEEESGAMLIWVKDGMLYGLRAASASQVQAAAASLP